MRRPPIRPGSTITVEQLRSRESEASFMARVINLAKLNHFWVFHDHDSRTNQAGLPDLLLVKPPRVLWVELKALGGRLRLEQVIVLDLLSQAGQQVYVWRPDDWPEIEQTLTRGS